MEKNQDLVRCPYCGMEAPAENLLCIYCGRSLNLRTSFSKGVWFFLIAFALVVAFMIWLM